MRSALCPKDETPFSGRFDTIFEESLKEILAKIAF